MFVCTLQGQENRHDDSADKNSHPPEAPQLSVYIYIWTLQNDLKITLKHQGNKDLKRLWNPSPGTEQDLEIIINLKKKNKLV